MRTLATAFGISKDTIHKILTEDLGLSKKSARWVAKLLSEKQKQERVQLCNRFIAAVHRHSLAWLDKIVSLDVTMVSLHTAETKRQSKRRAPKRTPGPVKLASTPAETKP